MFAEDYLTLKLVRLKPPEGWVGKPEGLSFLFVKGGVGEFVADDLAQRLTSGDTAVICGSRGGKLYVSNGGDFTFWSFSLRIEHLFPLFAGEELSLLQNITDGFKALKVYPASTTLAKECHRLVGDISPQFNLDHRSQLLRVAAAILSEEFRTAQGHRAGFVRVEDHMIRVFEKLSAEELLSLSVGDLADRFGCSRRHLNRLFHQYFGFSVATLRMEMRLLKAVSLLRNPDAKVIAVAEQCRFNHLGLFNTCFKRRFGVSPGQWRKKSLEKKNDALGESEGCPLHSMGLCPLSGVAQKVSPVAPDVLPSKKPGPTRLLNIMPAARESLAPEPEAIPQSIASGSNKRTPARRPL